VYSNSRLKALPRLALAGLLASAVCGAAAPASALTILANFDSSVTGQANATAIETAFNKAADVYEGAFSNAATIHINVSWGTVAGRAMPSGAVGASSDSLYGYFTYDQIRADLTASSGRTPTDTVLATALGSLTATAPAGPTRYVIPSAEAKALGMISGTGTGVDGSIGFSASSPFDFNPIGGVTAGSYDFEAIAAHEIAEVLGRFSGITSSPQFRTPFDLFRYVAPGAPSAGYMDSAYFSINRGVTALKAFNNVGGGDRGDWLGVTGLYDVSNAFLTKGQPYAVSNADLTALDVLGWGGTNAGGTGLSNPTGQAFNLVSVPDGVPEPGTWAMMTLGFLAMASALRRRSRSPAMALNTSPVESIFPMRSVF
jgi:hypothetical protein